MLLDVHLGFLKFNNRHVAQTLVSDRTSLRCSSWDRMIRLVFRKDLMCQSYAGCSGGDTTFVKNGPESPPIPMFSSTFVAAFSSGSGGNEHKLMSSIIQRSQEFYPTCYLDWILTLAHNDSGRVAFQCGNLIATPAWALHGSKYRIFSPEYILKDVVYFSESSCT